MIGKQKEPGWALFYIVFILLSKGEE
jgi:hypothetical protein